MKEIIRFFAQRYLLCNLMLFGIIACAIFSWERIGKEEMPEFAPDELEIDIAYPGASAEDVELFVTKPVERKLRGISGYEQIHSSSVYGRSSIEVEFDPQLSNPDKIIQDTKDAVEQTQLPRQAEDPVYDQFSSATKAIIDVALYSKESKLLNIEQRRTLQEYVLAFENQILALPEISGIERRGYRMPEIHIRLKPEKLNQYDISPREVREKILSNHVRMPSGDLENREQTEITVISELDTIPALQKTIIRGGFEGQKIRLSEVATIERGFKESDTIRKAQGREAVVLNIQKSAATDILTAQKAIMRFIERFEQQNPNAPIGLVTLDDESYQVRNRLSLIGMNGLIGFSLITLILLLFLNFRSGCWVAIGVPFSLAMTLLLALSTGFTVNNMTLAAIIVVLGIVVDDAIIVAENIGRLRRKGYSLIESAVEGTYGVIRPIVASILTTCVAFLPLYYFSGRFGLLVVVIPTIISFMLLASIFKSAFILPSLLAQPDSRVGYFKVFGSNRFSRWRDNWIDRIERNYQNIIQRAFGWRIPILICFLGISSLAILVFNSQMRFVMFPREESTEIAVEVLGPPDITREEMARRTEKIDQLFLDDDHGVVLAHLTRIGESRRGGEAEGHEANFRVEILPPDERDISLDELLKDWRAKADKIEGFENIRFMRSRWGSDSGDPIEIEVRENDDQVRLKALERLADLLRQQPSLENIDIEMPVMNEEYRFHVKNETVSRLQILPNQLGETIRTLVEGDILYTLNKGDEEVDVRLTGDTSNSYDIESVLDMQVANIDNYLVPLRSIVNPIRGEKPSHIYRINFKRTDRLFAAITAESKVTPLEMGELIETEIFPQIMKENPSTVLQFDGEIKESRESGDDFTFAIYLVIGLIFVLLVILFNSFWLPILIISTVPFGVIGVIFTFYLHGMIEYGFFSVIGTLGMVGVVVNNAIVMISKLENTRTDYSPDQYFQHTAEISATRLRPVVLTTLTTVAGLLPTAYGWAGYDSMLSGMMLALCWGLIFSTLITLILVPCLYSYYRQFQLRTKGSHHAS